MEKKNDVNKEKKCNIINYIICLHFIIITALLWIFVNFKCVILTIGIFSLLFYINISTTTIANAFIGRSINVNYDIFWKVLFILISSISFGIFFNI